MFKELRSQTVSGCAVIKFSLGSDCVTSFTYQQVNCNSLSVDDE